MDICITNRDWTKVINFAKCAEDKWGTEIGGMAVTIEDKDGDWWIKEPVILKQEVSGGSCDLDKAELAKYYGKMELKYRNHNMRFCWWHSHANMNAFWSGTDTSTIDEYKDGDLSFALVVNIKGEYKCRISVWKPIEMHEDVELNVQQDDAIKIPKRISNEVEELCTQPTRNITSYVGGIQSQTNLWRNRAKKEDPMEDFIGNVWEGLIEKVEELNGELTMGSSQYEEYASTLEKLNNKLQTQNIPLKVRILSRNTMEEVVYMDAHQLIECTDPKYSDLNPHMLYGGYNGAY